MTGSLMFHNLPRMLPILGCVVGGAIGTSIAFVGVDIIVVLAFSFFLAASAGWFLYRIGKR